MFKKILTSFFLSLILNIFLIAPIKAEGEFIIDSSVEYKIQDSGNTQVTHTITLENVFSNLYATAYSLILDNIQAENVSSRDFNNEPLTINQEKKDGQTNLKVTFNDAVVGKGNKRTFYINYSVSNLAQKTGEVWEISIPRLSDEKSFRNYSVNLLIPNSFKNEAYLSPTPSSKGSQDGFRTYVFNKEAVAKTGVTAGFGDFQVFSFKLIYHLENPLIKNAAAEIALPPDTAFQKIFYEDITPRPNNISIDADGNWLAAYILKPRERVDIEATGFVQLFAKPRQFTQPSTDILARNLSQSDFWQINDPLIINLAQQFQTPKNIYNFVSTKLKYDYSRVKPNVERLGALEVLKNPGLAICMEYTDLFISLARAAGIPAREINGYAYTENPQIQPLSLVADVLHAWPEYWDETNGVWIPIDPTWASTTGGVDFFSKLDLRHFTFVIHGSDAVKPYPPGSYKLGPNPQKDVFVNFGNLPVKRGPIIEIFNRSANFIPFTSQTVKIEIKNSGNEANLNTFAEVFFDNKQISREALGTIPPFALRSFTVSIPFSLLGTKTPRFVKIIVGADESTTQTAKTEMVIYNLVLIFILFTLVIIAILIKLDKIKPGKIINAIKKFKIRNSA